MWTQVETVIEQHKQQLGGCDIHVLDALDGVVTLRLTPSPSQSQDELQDVRTAIGTALTCTIPLITNVIFETRATDGVEADQHLTIAIGEPDDATDTCRFTLSRSIAERAAYYGSATQAHGTPLVEPLFNIPGIASLLVKDNILIVSRLDGEWSYLNSEIERTIRAHFEGIAYKPSSPRLSTVNPGDLRQRVQELLEDEINPSLAAHGGFIRIVDLVDTTLYLSMEGGCQGCGMASATLREGVQKTLMSEVPEITKIVDSTDHQAGSNPYY